jgi:hypothetical protein
MLRNTKIVKNGCYPHPDPGIGFPIHSKVLLAISTREGPRLTRKPTPKTSNRGGADDTSSGSDLYG